VTVIRKGSRAVQQLPASPDAFVWLRLYQSGLAGAVPLGWDDPLWVTRRRPFRPLTYHAARAMFSRATAALGANWTLHDLRHTAAYRMARDPLRPQHRRRRWPTRRVRAAGNQPAHISLTARREKQPLTPSILPPAP